MSDFVIKKLEAAIYTDAEKQGAHAVPTEVESKLIITAAGFLGRQLEG